MKKLLFIVLINLLLSFTSVLNAQQDTFSRVLFDSAQYGIQAYSVVPTFDNCYLIAGDESHQNGLIIKVDSTGNVLWNKTFSNSNTIYNSDIFFSNIISTKDSCFVIVGFTYDSISSHRDALCLKIDSNGDTLWLKTIGYNDNDFRTYSVQQTNDSGYIMTGYASNYNTTPNYKIFVAKLDMLGNLQWSNIILGGNYNSTAYSIKQTPDSAYILTGYMTNLFSYEHNVILIKLSQTGAILWSKRYYNPAHGYCKGYDLEITGNGFLILFLLDYHIVLLETDFSGNILWQKSYNQFIGSMYYEYSTKFMKTSDSCFVLVSIGFDGGLTKIDSVGNLIWSKSLNLMATDVVNSNSHGFFIIGNGPVSGVKGNQISSPQIGIIQTDSIGNAYKCVYSMNLNPIIDTILSTSATFSSVSGGIENTIHPIISSEVLLSYNGCISYFGSINEISNEKNISVFPNPSNGVFTFNIEMEKEVQVIIYNSIGENIYQSKFYNQEFEIDLSSKPEGVYLVKFICEDFVGVKKIVKQ